MTVWRLSGLITCSLVMWSLLAGMVLRAPYAAAQVILRHGDALSVSGDLAEIRMIPPFTVRVGTQGHLFTTNVQNGKIIKVQAATFRVIDVTQKGKEVRVVSRIMSRTHPLTSEYWFGAYFDEVSRDDVPAYLSIQSTPSGASVLVNGQRRGVAPTRLELPPGTYSVQISLSGYRTEERQMSLKGGDFESLLVALSTIWNIEEGRSGDFYFQKGVVLMEIEDYDRAARYLERAAALLPDNARARDLFERASTLAGRRATRPVLPVSAPPISKDQVVETPSPAPAPAPAPVVAAPAPAPVVADAARSVQPPAGWTGKPPDGLESWRTNARKFMEKNDMAGAEVYVRNILDWNPNDEEARAWMSRITGPTPTITHTDENMQIVQFPDGQQIRLARLPGGTFDMGDSWGDGDPDEKPVHAITVSDFWLSTHEITNRQFATFLNSWGNQLEEGVYWLDVNDEDCQITLDKGKYVPREGFEDMPVVEVTWFGARAFAQWMGGRLPTEAEWEFAARNGGRNIKFPSGGSLTSNEANISGTDGKDQWEPSSPVGSFAPNTFGLHDLAGNVWEWCQDWYAREYYSNSRSTNPDGPLVGEARVLRGGSWYDPARLCRVSYRNMNRPTESRVNIGFRVMMPKK